MPPYDGAEERPGESKAFRAGKATDEADAEGHGMRPGRETEGTEGHAKTTRL